MMDTPRRCVEKVLKGEKADRIPFTIYEGKIPQCSAERRMRNDGLCIVNRVHPVFRVVMPDVKIEEYGYFTSDGKKLVRTTYTTPVGSVSTVVEGAGFTSWRHEKLFKSPDDYKVLAFMLANERYIPCYDGFIEAEKAGGEDIIYRSGFGLEPLQTLMSGDMIDMQDFCIEWMENRDEILKLYDLVVANRRKIYPIVAESPAFHANYGGNVTPSIIGKEVFEKYYLPHYAEAAEVMHKHHKKIGCHFDADCRLLAPLIARTPLDYIEAFTPFDTDMSLLEGYQAWPDKVLWINYPSSWHLKSDSEIEEQTVEMIRTLPDRDRLIVGITEDIPPSRWQQSCQAIMKGLSLA